MDKRFNVHEGFSNADTFGKLRLEARSELNSDLFFLISSDIRFYDFPNLTSSFTADDIESDYPWDFLLWEAYVEINKFIWDDLDLKLGKQRIAWGRADTFNPTDNLNPDDFTNFFDFGEKIPSYALKADYYAGDYTITAVWLPYFEPALLPKGGTVSLLGKTPVEVDLPAITIENSMFALKLQGNALGWDYSFSYFNGYDDIPIEFENSDRLVMGFPEMQVVGFDFSGEIRSVGLWGEVAAFFPEEVKSGPELILSDEAFFKYTLGLDYTFKNGIYLQVQYLHGLFTGRGLGNRNDHIITNIEKDFLNDELTLSLTTGLEVKDIDDFEDSYGTFLVPEVSYRPLDNIELSLGAFLLGGKEETLFGKFKDSDQIYFKAKVDF